ncbi:MAG: alpha/beta fold hydrolase [Pseudomonadota bacterium]|nr:MAG: alpha/beta hydrolase [Pseudomonadota bacterium]
MAERPLILFAPGAGAPSSSAWMQAFARRLEAIGDVVSFDYPYMRAGRKRPDPLPVLIAAHRDALEGARRDRSGSVFLVGKSMGGRVGCHVALETEVTGLVCLGYPLKGAGPRATLRDEVLIRLRTPILFVQGTRDSLCPLPLLEATRARMQAPHRLFVVEGGDHSLRLTQGELRRRGETQEQVDARIVETIRDFVASH